MRFYQLRSGLMGEGESPQGESPRVAAARRALFAEGIISLPQLDDLAARALELDRNRLYIKALFEGILFAFVTAISHVISNPSAKAITVLMLSALAAGVVEGTSKHLKLLTQGPKTLRRWTGWWQP